MAKDKVYSFVLGLPIVRSIVGKKFQDGLDKEEKKVIEELQKHWDHRKVSALPSEGMTDENIRKRIYEWV